MAGLSIAFLPGMETDEISNDHFRITFDRKKGRFYILRKNGASLLSGGAVCVNTPGRKQFISRKNSVTTRSFKDALGGGKQLIIHAKDDAKKTDMEIRLSLYDSLPVISMEATVKNISRQDIVIHSIEPVRALRQEDGKLARPGVSKCLTNGEMYFDTGRVYEFGKGNAASTENIKGIQLANKSITAETIHSWWNIGLFSGYDKEGIAIGYLENDQCLGNFVLAKTAAGEISFLAESVYPPGQIVKPGKTIDSNRVVICTGENIYAALESYAEAVGKINNARVNSILNGWCSWFYTLSQVSEKEVVANTAFAAKHLKPYGLEYIQIDEGYQQWHGEWEGNERFPNGMKWLADNIKAQGFKAGLWISPYVISEPTKVFQQHPEWLLKRRDGSLQRVGNWPENTPPPADENPKRYGLDITHPGAAQWLHDLIHRIVHEWGYEMIKIDFVAWSILAAERYYDPTLSAAQVYRKGMEIMRQAAGEKCHILECGPGATTVGLIDSMRIELDSNYGFAAAAWDTYFLNAASSMSAAAKRYYFHKRTWINDADHVCLELLNNQQSEAAATIIALSGGNLFSGDRLTQLDCHKLEIFKKITPSFGEAARPVDLFDSDTQSVFALKIKKPFAEWTIAGFFNADLEKSVEKKFSIDRLWLDPGKTYLAFDFWKQQFIGEISGEISVNVLPGSVTLLTLHEKTGKPQFISTDRHVMQGAMETEQVSWNEESKIISGISTGPLHTSHNVFIYLPEEQPWTWGGSALYRDCEGYSVKLVDKHILRVHVSFEKSESVEWQIPENLRM